VPQLRVSAWAPLRHRAFRMLWLAQLQAFLRAGTEPDVERSSCHRNHTIMTLTKGR